MFLQMKKIKKSVSVSITTQSNIIRRERADIQNCSQSPQDLSHDTEHVSVPAALDLYSRGKQFKA
jgi:hypothetical protein